MTGGYHQDWLLEETDWNWAAGGRAPGPALGGRRHRLALAGPGRLRHRAQGSPRPWPTCTPSCPSATIPLTEVGTFAGHAVDEGVERVRERMTSDDAAGILLRLEGGVRGVCSISQVSAGRKNRLDLGAGTARRAGRLDLRGAGVPVAGHRDRPNEKANKANSALMSGSAPPSPAIPPATSRATPTPSAGCSPPSTPTSPTAGRRPTPPTRPSPTATTSCLSATPSSSPPSPGPGRQ